MLPKLANQTKRGRLSLSIGGKPKNETVVDRSIPLNLHIDDLLPEKETPNYAALHGSSSSRPVFLPLKSLSEGDVNFVEPTGRKEGKKDDIKAIITEL